MLQFLLLFGIAHVVLVGGLRVVNPPLTATMVGATIDHRRLPRLQWRSLDALGHTPRMAVAGEDSAFWMHNGFDWIGICSAIDTNRRNAAQGSSARSGGNTIPQQVARNVFLWQGRSWLRKGLEVWFTVWLVALVPRERILELYLNIAQTGPTQFGMEAGAKRAFGKPASKLGANQSARLIAILPAPATWTVSDANVQGHARTILNNRDPWPGEEHYEAVAAKYNEKNPGALGCAWRQLTGRGR